MCFVFFCLKAFFFLCDIVVIEKFIETFLWLIVLFTMTTTTANKIQKIKSIDIRSLTLVPPIQKIKYFIDEEIKNKKMRNKIKLYNAEVSMSIPANNFIFMVDT